MSNVEVFPRGTSHGRKTIVVQDLAFNQTDEFVFTLLLPNFTTL